MAQKITPLEKRAPRHFGPFFQPSTKALQDPSFGRPTPTLNQQTGVAGLRRAGIHAGKWGPIIILIFGWL